MTTTGTTVIATAFAYLLVLAAVAWWAERRALTGRSLLASPWIYTLSLGVYCTAWTYFGSIGRAATAGIWFLPIYLGPTLAMIVAWQVLRRMIRIARTWRITSIADFIASRHGKSPVLAGLVTVITLVGIVPYVALQIKAIASGYAVLVAGAGDALPAPAWWSDSTLYIALALALFTMAFGARHLDATERHQGLVVAIAFESVVKLLAFIAVGVFVCWGIHDGLGDLFARALAEPSIARLLSPGTDTFAWSQWFALNLLAMLSVILLPRQFQIMVVENTDERHVRRAAWAFPLYLLLINLFVLPIAFGGLLQSGGDASRADIFVLSLPLAFDHSALALLAFIGGFSAATGMIIVETIAVSTMICNDLVMPLLLRHGRGLVRNAGDLSGLLLATRRFAILLVLMLGYLYFRIAGDAYALVSIGLISFAAVAQFAPALFGGMYWKGGTRDGAIAGLVAGFALWGWTLMLPSIARSGWIDDAFVDHGPFGLSLLRPEQLFGLTGFDNLTHALFWSLLANVTLYVGLSLWRLPSAAEAAQAQLFVDILERDQAERPVFWRGRARVADLRALATRFLGPARTAEMFDGRPRPDLAGTGELSDGRPQRDGLVADPKLVQFVETQLAGAIGSASARVAVASVVDEDVLALDDVIRIVDEASELRSYSRALEEKSRSLERASAELKAANEQLQELDRLKDDFMSSVTHELRTPLTSIRALAELMRDSELDEAEREQFTTIMITETDRLARLVNQVLDMAKIEAGHGEWHSADVDLAALITHAAQATAAMFRDRGATLSLRLPPGPQRVRADADRLTQVLMNLLSNAAKFVPREHGRVEIALERAVRDDGERLVVEVSDNGPGVPEHQRELVFERFRQGGDPSNRPQGTGLGLPISRRIVEHFGGRIWLRPAPGGGACFGFDLPTGGDPDVDQRREGDQQRSDRNDGRPR
ncbi:MAG: sensor histidine kinase [Burkholderiaceae bacterium]